MSPKEDCPIPVVDTSGWTFETLLYHIEQLLAAQDARHEIQDKRYSERQEASDKAITAALNSAAIAVNKAETAYEKRFDAVNEFRATLADQQRTLMPRPETEILFAGVKAQISSLSIQLTELTKQVSINHVQLAGEKSGKVEGWKDIALVISVVVSILSVISLVIVIVSRIAGG